MLLDSGGYVPLLGYGFPLLLLVSIAERPFLSAAGIRQHALALSLQANVLGGLMMSGFFLCLESEAGRAIQRKVPFEAPFVLLVTLWAGTTAIEFFYLRHRDRTLGDAAFRVIWNANLVSFVAIPFIYAGAKIVGQTLGTYLWNQSSIAFWRWAAIGQRAYGFLTIVSAILFASSFVWPYLSDRRGKGVSTF